MQFNNNLEDNIKYSDVTLPMFFKQCRQHRFTYIINDKPSIYHEKINDDPEFKNLKESNDSMLIELKKSNEIRESKKSKKTKPKIGLG